MIKKLKIQNDFVIGGVHVKLPEIDMIQDKINEIIDTVNDGSAYEREKFQFKIPRGRDDD